MLTIFLYVKSKVLMHNGLGFKLQDKQENYSVGNIFHIFDKKFTKPYRLVKTINLLFNEQKVVRTVRVVVRNNLVDPRSYIYYGPDHWSPETGT